MSKTCSFSRVIDGQRYYCGNLTKEGEDFCWRHKSDYKTPLERCREENEELNIENALLRGALSEIIIQVNETRKVISERK